MATKKTPGKPLAPPDPPPLISIEDIRRLDKLARKFAKDPAKLKRWLTRKRLFHLLMQDRFATKPPPGRSGPAIMARASARFLDMSDPLSAALADIPDDDDEAPEENEPANRKAPADRSVARTPKAKGRKKHRIPPR